MIAQHIFRKVDGVWIYKGEAYEDGSTTFGALEKDDRCNHSYPDTEDECENYPYALEPTGSDKVEGGGM